MSEDDSSDINALKLTRAIQSSESNTESILGVARLSRQLELHGVQDVYDPTELAGLLQVAADAENDLPTGLPDLSRSAAAFENLKVRNVISHDEVSKALDECVKQTRLVSGPSGFGEAETLNSPLRVAQSASPITSPLSPTGAAGFLAVVLAFLGGAVLASEFGLTNSGVIVVVGVIVGIKRVFGKAVLSVSPRRRAAFPGRSPTALYDEAVQASLSRDFRTAVEIWEYLGEHYGDARSSFDAGCITAFAAARSPYQRIHYESALSTLQPLAGDAEYGRRASVVLAALLFLFEPDGKRAAAMLGAAAKRSTDGASSAERRAAAVAQYVVTRDVSNSLPKTAVSAVAEKLLALESAPHSRRRELAHRRSLAAQVITGLSTVASTKTALSWSSSAVPNPAGGVVSEVRDRLSRDIAVLSGDDVIADRDSANVEVRIARWLTERFHPATGTILNFVLAVVTSALVLSGHIGWAAVSFSVCLLVESVDGRMAQLAGSRARKLLLFDYIIDRVGDAVLTVGFLVYSAQHLTGDIATLCFVAAAIYGTASLLASYIRAESARLQFSGGGGTIERPFRHLILLIGLATGQPVLGLVIAALGAAFNCVERLRNALRDDERDIRGAGLDDLGLTLVGHVPLTPVTDERSDVAW